MANGDPEDRPQDKSNGAAWQTVLGLVGLVALVYGGYRLVKAVDPGKIATSRDPGVLELLISDRTVLTSLRVAVIFGLCYLIWSIYKLMERGRFLTAIPGVSVSEAAKQAQAVGEEAVSEQEALEKALAEANDDIGFLVEYVDHLQEQLNEDENATDNDEGEGAGAARPVP